MGMTAPRQARSERTLQSILDACDRLLLDRPFERISMQDIAREAGVSVGNLYNRFADKSALVDHVTARHQARIIESLSVQLTQEENRKLDTRARLEHIVHGVMSAIVDLGPLLVTQAARLARGELTQPTVRGNSDVLVELMADWLLAGDDSLDPERCRFAVASIAFGVQFNLLFGSPVRMFGDGFAEQLVEQAYCYLFPAQ
ncbi:MAG: TetR/AcrR family transcriptional regulator [Halieaceae bacterium]|nr:TetR/AcrR family transcriptional regulator [Halieaceae bacterium]